MEHLIKACLDWYLEHCGILSDSMAEFRERICIGDNLLDLCSSIEHSRERKQATLVDFSVVANAFDNVPVPTVARRLLEIGISGRGLQFIVNFLTDLTFRVRLKGSYSSEHRFPSGLPQESVLGPILFNIVMAALPSCIPRTHRTVHLSLYADILCFWISGFRLRLINSIAHQVITAIQSCLWKYGLHLAATKSAYMVFNPCRQY